jgi:hypothetical protein
MSSPNTQARVGQVLVDFAVESKYPEEEAVIAANVESSALPTALELLNSARASLEVGSYLSSYSILIPVCSC